MEKVLKYENNLYFGEQFYVHKFITNVLFISFNSTALNSCYNSSACIRSPWILADPNSILEVLEADNKRSVCVGTAAW